MFTEGWSFENMFSMSISLLFRLMRLTAYSQFIGNWSDTDVSMETNTRRAEFVPS